MNPNKENVFVPKRSKRSCVIKSKVKLEQGRKALKNVGNICFNNKKQKEAEKIPVTSKNVKEAANIEQHEEIAIQDLDPAKEVKDELDPAKMLPIDIESVPIISDVQTDPQHVCEYVQEIQYYLLHMETRPQVTVRKHFLSSQSCILPRMRAVVVDWMVGVSLQLDLHMETLHMAVSCLDRFLQTQLDTTTKDKLQLIGVTALLVAAKYEETFPPKVSDLSYLAGGGAPETEILETERAMLQVLGFSLCSPLSLQFLRWARVEDPVTVTQQIHCLAKYMVELSLVDYHLVHILPSMRAAAAVTAAVRILGQTAAASKWIKQFGSSSGSGYSVYSLYWVMKRMVQILSVASSNKTLLTIYRKFTNRVFLKIARHPVLARPIVIQYE